MYVGRTKRNIGHRLRGHINTADDCPFAFRFAREATGRTEARYSGADKRENLLKDPEFSGHYTDAKERIRRMCIRWVQESASLFKVKDADGNERIYHSQEKLPPEIGPLLSKPRKRKRRSRWPSLNPTPF